MALYPKAVKKLIPPDPNRDPRITARVVILHVDAGNAESLYNWFNGPSGGVESHFFVKKDGTVEQYRDTAYQADANTDANDFAISIETQGFAAGEWTPEQLASIKALLLWCHQVHAIPLTKVQAWNGSGVGYHTLFPGSWDKRGASCPGPDRIKQFNNVIVPWLAAPVLEEDPMATFTEQDLKDAAGSGVLGAQIGREEVAPGKPLTVGIVLSRLYASVAAATARDVAQTAAITTLAQNQGVDPQVVKAAVEEALSAYRLTLTKEQQ